MRPSVPKQIVAPLLILVCLFLNASPAFGQTPAAASSGASVETSIPSEPSLMILAASGILILGLLIVRILLRLGIVRSLIWVLPILIVLTGGVWLEMAIAKHPGVPNLHALIRFMFLFLLFITALTAVARVALPSSEQITRGGVPPLIRGLAVFILALLGLFILLTWSFPALSFTPVFITSGVVSIVIGLAVQDLIEQPARRRRDERRAALQAGRLGQDRRGGRSGGADTMARHDAVDALEGLHHYPEQHGCQDGRGQFRPAHVAPWTSCHRRSDLRDVPRHCDDGHAGGRLQCK